MSTIEFYLDDKRLLSVAAEFVPPVGSFININKVTYTVERATYAIDYSGGPFEGRRLRCNIDLTATTTAAKGDGNGH